MQPRESRSYAPGHLTADAVRSLLPTGVSAAYPTITVVEETGSTNADLVTEAAAGAEDRTVLLARHQTSGRGRHQRGFGAPPGTQFIVSILLRPAGVSPERLGLLTLVAGLALLGAVRGRCGLRGATLKWPNDVLVGGRKLAGILAEVAALSPAPAVVVGVGVNLGIGERDLPVPHATSLLLEGAEESDVIPVAAAFLEEFDLWERRWRSGAVDIVADFRRECDTLGRRVRALLPGGRDITGIAVDIDSGGSLVIRVDPDGDRTMGETVTVSAGDVTHLRPEEVDD